MLFLVGIEPPKKESEAWGIVVPAFEKIGLLCVSAADRRTEILPRAKQAILTMVEEALNDGHLLSQLEPDLRDYRLNNPECDEWLALEVSVEHLRQRQKRINITMSEALLARVDSFVQVHPEYKDRSDFLAKAADELMFK
ncbi:type II toxin-antitoxin system HicB family antitoxin [Pseudidiomarina homiensis]|uniref:type II toxin-antitoxin system HicB family antitoxin n=1 Tax=Pseudidiomarina homiensis TaxID=364198 RepID=UPI00215A2A6C|nr:type II toxin-antitoxin system HicB family antitoxin [Pseudidiomarina homiensis]